MTEDTRQEEHEALIEEIGEHEKAKARALHRLLVPVEKDADLLIPGYDDLPNWLSASKVAPLVGKSKSWVVDNADKFDARRDENGYYMIPKRAVLRYLQTRTEKVEP